MRSTRNIQGAHFIVLTLDKMKESYHVLLFHDSNVVDGTSVGESLTAG